MTDSKLLYFVETTPIKEQIFNSYMQDAVNLYNEEFLAEIMHESFGAINLADLNGKLVGKWLEMVRDN